MPENPKNIVICCDGTGNKFGERNSNVVKLYTALKINNDQVGYYHPGLGTMGAPNARTRVGKAWSVLSGLAFGGGFLDNVEDAYRYLMSVYHEGDRVYLFGFSRGAYTVRALAGILQAYGLLCRGNEGHIPYVLRMFTDDLKKMRKAGGKTLNEERAFKATFSRPVTLHFVGLWDTVSSVGWIYEPVKLLYSAQNPIVQTGRHAVSIDERRCFFQDNLWGRPLEEGTPDLKAPQDILQVWFAGVHSDVGGSYPPPESALANAALEWMLDEAIAAGLQVVPERREMIVGQGAATDHPAAVLYPPAEQPGALHQSLVGPWWLLELLPHRRYEKDDAQEKWGIPLGKRRQVTDAAIVHSSVVRRMDSARDYAPGNLPRKRLFPYRDVGGELLSQRVFTPTQARLDDFFVYLPEQQKQAASRDMQPRAAEVEIEKTPVAMGKTAVRMLALAGVGLAMSLVKGWRGGTA